MELTSHGLPRLTKERIIREYLSGAKTSRMLAKEYDMSQNAINHMIRRHRDKYFPNFDVNPIISAINMKAKTKPEFQNEKLLAENQELRRQLQLAQLKIEGYETIGEILDEEYGIDLLKKAVAGQCRVSRKDTQM